MPQSKDKNKTTNHTSHEIFLWHLSKHSLAAVCRVPNSTSRPLWHCPREVKTTLRLYRGADKSLARTGMKKATATKLQLLEATQKKNQKFVLPTRSPRQQWPPRRTKNCELSIVFFSRVGLRTYQHFCKRTTKGGFLGSVLHNDAFDCSRLRKSRRSVIVTWIRKKSGMKLIRETCSIRR